MFAHIEGIVAEKTADSIVLDAGGVGFELNVSASTLSAAPSVGERMKLYCCLSVREDAMELFGFYSREEKHMYQRLRGVSGVGSYCFTTANTSPLTSHEESASCCMAAKLLTPVASHALLFSDQRANSRSA